MRGTTAAAMPTVEAAEDNGEPIPSGLLEASGESLFVRAGNVGIGGAGVSSCFDVIPELMDSETIDAALVNNNRYSRGILYVTILTSVQTFALATRSGASFSRI